LPENQTLALFETIKPVELLDLYNVAQAQALLYRSVEMRLWLEPQAAEGFRELFGAIKAYRLIHTVRGNSRDGYEVRLDGPASIFQRSQKYGIQMAVFLPALLLCKGWRMRAEIQRTARRRLLRADERQTRLRSHYPTARPTRTPSSKARFRLGARRGRLVARAEQRSDRPRRLRLHTRLRLRHAETGARVFLEVLGFWTPEHLRERLLEFDHAGN
jgi:predicted nuclease of restriction endonuclease-like RecB superfamily